MNLKQMANAARMLSVEMIERAKSGHPGVALGMADVMTVLWTKFIHFDIQNPTWENRDRFVFSNGHGSSLLYSVFYLLGFPKMTLEQLKKFRQLGSITPGHPELNTTPGVDFSAGPLGQGVASSVGMALAAKIQKKTHKVYCSVGDGCLMEGVAQEAIALAGLWKLNNLIVLWDDNKITIDGSTNISSGTNMKMRFEADGWRVFECDGHDFDAIEKALNEAQNSDQPVLIDCKTIIGFGAPTKAGTPSCHGAPLGAEEIAGLRQRLNWPYPAFEVPEDILSDWRQAGRRTNSIEAKKTPLKINFSLKKLMSKWVVEKPEMATRKAGQQILESILRQCPEVLGGSADLGGSNLTKTALSKEIMPPTYEGNYLNYGIREHAMAAITNGLAAYGGFVPYASTFFVFSDYLRPSVRLAALMKLREVFIFTHDSVAVGEDGPTHQPIEHLASFRAMPGVHVFRPADGIEVAESYQLAFSKIKGPSIIALSRQNLPTVRSEIKENLTAKGGYVLREAKGKRRITLIATGSEVSLALQIADKIPNCAVVSMPCLELFSTQSLDYQKKVLGIAPRIVIEMAASFGWEKWIDEKGLVIGIDSFGASAPGDKLAQYFGFTGTNIVKKILAEQKKK
ncbi:MAG: transketolase [Alphaproteobacteria bacterium]|nr:transketolase [Alphaproteobacteria bacterium]